MEYKYLMSHFSNRNLYYGRVSSMVKELRFFLHFIKLLRAIAMSLLITKTITLMPYKDVGLEDWLIWYIELAPVSWSSEGFQLQLFIKRVSKK
jgi:hypothetical protein